MSVTAPKQQTVDAAADSRSAAIEAVDLAKSYGRGERAVPALRGVSFAAPTGSILGLLGPNGAGKSTAVKILTTLSAADSGTATVAGIDVATDPAGVRRVIGYVPQKPCFDPNLTGRENLTLQAKIYGMKAGARGAVDDMLARFDLTDAADRITRKWSGGMQRKLDVAMGLIHGPAVLFLDEPTTGLDPEARSDLWTAIAELTASGSLTVLLTTHYLEEADQLADHLVIVDRGVVVAAGTPEQLKDDLAGDTIHVRLAATDQAEAASKAVSAVDGVEQVTAAGRDVRARTAVASTALPKVLAALEAAAVPISSVTAARPSLDQVYLHHAGREFDAGVTTNDKEAAAR
ncbi:ATP-binding cassette domain-containing protein [Solwaraspora sp. WMMD406]|uniref:ABC transporter ATP-binding protein n=1 Tax=Solwaraspora sp. WMMD406 TaxID=3016095 RepID=UPI0024164245|nr:ATP-binding cassette domain-containing protein [Solwaraspora sp. WMMD406]MDG4766913.1 ATP-binding cassette domain-containing protein [Solwaraspora sp. WMMD406]